ncbi:Protein of unknown function [Leuconostoc citreum]|nr:Protein of unknown function [Leuconostoc citreum]
MRKDLRGNKHDY